MAYTMDAFLCSGCSDNKMTPAFLHEFLQSRCDQPIYLKINDNRSTMCSIRWESDKIKVSLNRIFLDAPKRIIQALSKTIKKREEEIPPVVKAFIHRRLIKLDYSGQLDSSVLDYRGHVYNLKNLYDDINREYFNGKLKLKITWFGVDFKQDRAQFIFGLYYDALKLIKINRVMDTVKFPEYVVRFVIYHEMLHFVSPTYVDDIGIHRTHNTEFKLLEKQFKDFARAKLWIRRHRSDLFDDFDLELRHA